MIKKKINNIKIGFLPSFQLVENHCLINNSSDELIFNPEYLNYEISGEKFIGCANINPQAKIMTGYLKYCEEKNISTEVIYSSRFISRDLMAALEIFSKSNYITMKKINYEESNATNSNNLKIKSIDEFLNINKEMLNNNILQELSPILFDKIRPLIISDRQINQDLEFKGETLFFLVIIGTAPPCFADIYDFLKNKNCIIFYFEYLNLMFSSIFENKFSEKEFFDMNHRHENISSIIKLLDDFIKSETFAKTYGSNKKGKIKILHFFPKFSHYEIEDSYFNKKITCQYLSVEYAGGAFLSLRDKIRIEAFLN